MGNGMIIFAHRDEVLLKRVEEAVCLRCPKIHIERTTDGRELLMMQAFLRADAVVLNAYLSDVSVEHVIYELKRDIVNPYVVVYERNESMRRKWIGLGADAVIGAQTDLIRFGEEVETRIKRRREGHVDLLAERLLQRLFMERGIPCSLKGYRFLKTALILLSGCAFENAGSMNRLYEKIAQRHGCSAACVERNIRYVIELCWNRSAYAERMRPGNAEFIAQILEMADTEKERLLDPKISVYCSHRRVFK